MNVFILICTFPCAILSSDNAGTRKDQIIPHQVQNMHRDDEVVSVETVDLNDVQMAQDQQEDRDNHNKNSCCRDVCECIAECFYSCFCDCDDTPSLD